MNLSLMSDVELKMVYEAGYVSRDEYIQETLRRNGQWLAKNSSCSDDLPIINYGCDCNGFYDKKNRIIHIIKFDYDIEETSNYTLGKTEVDYRIDTMEFYIKKEKYETANIILKEILDNISIESLLK